MALPMRGIWAARYAQPSASAAVWGTGINAVHSYYGSPNIRLHPTRPMEGLPHGGEPPYWAPYEGPHDTHDYEYTELPNTVEGIYYDDRQGWDVASEDRIARYSTDQHPPYNAPGRVNNWFRSLNEGAHRLFRGAASNDYMPPSETVSEGWLNKPDNGEVARAKPSDPEQYERQTSMQQRFATRNNQLSLERATDEPRHPIGSRVMRQRIPVYSGERRHTDMFPYQQTPEREREFYYRTAGTGVQEWMQANQKLEVSAVERTPPPDPYIGQQDTQMQFGYTQEDYFYA
jgi:hypothetical protein